MDWTWPTVALLGAYHGLNPAMGWLFAVALGMQERTRKAVLQALPPIALGHEASLIGVLALVTLGELLATPDLVRLVGAGSLILFGAYKLLKPRAHPRWVGMRVKPRELALWSFLMSSAHGAGLMLFPILIGLSAGASAHDGHEHSLAGTSLTTVSLGAGLAAVLLHTAVMLVVMGVIAVVVYEKLGLAVLRKAWLNQDLIWAFALMTAGVLTLFVAA
ncbi:MAG: hypothetical protein Q7R32_00605 [Dehalococcoidia bacterium]|nr:hypothetical protein [Dehalococcoidia bacterium]